MPWRTTALEDFDDDHAAATAWTARLVGLDSGSGGLALRFCCGERELKKAVRIAPFSKRVTDYASATGCIALFQLLRRASKAVIYW
jgi:hypothetical protein